MGRSLALSAAWRRGQPQAAAARSLEAFLTERYLVYARAPGGRLSRQALHHPRWALHAAHDVEVEQRLVGAEGLPRLPSKPLAQVAAGTDVELFAPKWV